MDTRLRRRFKGSVWGLALLLLLAIVAERAGVFRPTGGDWERFDRKSFIASEVVDGDTLWIEGQGERERIRLIGVDAPEHDAHWGDRATAYARSRAQGKPVIINLQETQTRDRYGRLLAYVYLSESESLNLAMIRDGHAYADRRFSHPLRGQFEAAENEARKAKRGLWKEVTVEQMPEWRRKWLERQGLAQ